MTELSGFENEIRNKIQSSVIEKLNEMASRWENAIHVQHWDARMSGLTEVANALLRVGVHVVQKSDTQASLEIDSTALQLDELNGDMTYYILQCAKPYAFS